MIQYKKVMTCGLISKSQTWYFTAMAWGLLWCHMVWTLYLFSVGSSSWNCIDQLCSNRLHSSSMCTYLMSSGT